MSFFFFLAFFLLSCFFFSCVFCLFCLFVFSLLFFSLPSFTPRLSEGVLCALLFLSHVVTAPRLTALPYGDSTYKVTDGDIRPSSNTVDLEFRSPQEGGPWMCCTCGFPRRYKIPCRHVLAVVKRESASSIATCDFNAVKKTSSRESTPLLRRFLIRTWYSQRCRRAFLTCYETAFDGKVRPIGA